MSTSTQWMADALRKHDKVLRCDILSEYCIAVERKYYPDIIVGAISESVVGIGIIQKIVADNAAVDIVANIPKEFEVDSDLYDYCENKGIAFGGVANLFRAIGSQQIPLVPDATAEFVLRSLRQHSIVSKVTRIDHCRYRIERINKPTTEIVIIDAYDVTADVLRTAIERYGRTDVIACSNPNHRVSSMSEIVSKGSKVKVLSWSELYSSLNRSKL